MADESQSLSRFLDFINDQLDLSGLSDAAPLDDAQIEQAMTLIRSDIHTETLRVVDHLLRRPQRDHWQAQLAPFHREIRQCLARTVAGLMARRFPDRLSDDEWLDVATFLITVAWLVRKQMDGDVALPADD